MFISDYLLLEALSSSVIEKLIDHFFNLKRSLRETRKRLKRAEKIGDKRTVEELRRTTESTKNQLKITSKKLRSYKSALKRRLQELRKERDAAKAKAREFKRRGAGFRHPHSRGRTYAYSKSSFKERSGTSSSYLWRLIYIAAYVAFLVSMISVALAGSEKAYKEKKEKKRKLERKLRRT